MGRQVFDKFHATDARGAIRKALLRSADDDNFAFLRDHVDELTADDLVKVLHAGRAKEDSGVEPFILRLADIIATRPERFAIPILELAESVNTCAWADLTRRLCGRIPDRVWYFFVDAVRGGEIFNALNVRPLGLKRGDYLCYAATTRPQPLVAPLLESPNDDIQARAYALRSCPMAELLRLHQELPHHFALEGMQRSAASRATTTGDRWPRALPIWMVPHVVERLRVCEDDEAQDLYAWLLEQPPANVTCDFFELAFERFKLSPHTQAWHPHVGSHLVSGKEWKRRGVSVLAFCANYNKGFPPRVLTAALESAEADDAATAEKHRAAILKVVHDETAKVFVARAEHALKTQDWDTARKSLSALQCLDPGRFIRGRISYMRRIAHMPQDLQDLLEVCDDLTRAGGKEPAEQAVHDAFIALYGGLS